MDGGLDDQRVDFHRRHRHGCRSALLVGVAMGGFLTARVQKRQWARGQQIEACAAIVVESTRVQLSPRGQWKHDQRVDWAPAGPWRVDAMNAA
jgi:hypothetical protein